MLFTRQTFAFPWEKCSLAKLVFPKKIYVHLQNICIPMKLCVHLQNIWFPQRAFLQNFCIPPRKFVRSQNFCAPLRNSALLAKLVHSPRNFLFARKTFAVPWEMRSLTKLLRSPKKTFCVPSHKLLNSPEKFCAKFLGGVQNICKRMQNHYIIYRYIFFPPISYFCSSPSPFRGSVNTVVLLSFCWFELSVMAWVWGRTKYLTNQWQKDKALRKT